VKLQSIDGLNKEIEGNDIPLESQVNMLYDIMSQVINERTIKSRIGLYKLQNYIKSNNIYKNSK